MVLVLQCSAKCPFFVLQSSLPGSFGLAVFVLSVLVLILLYLFFLSVP